MVLFGHFQTRQSVFTTKWTGTLKTKNRTGWFCENFTKKTENDLKRHFLTLKLTKWPPFVPIPLNNHNFFFEFRHPKSDISKNHPEHFNLLRSQQISMDQARFRSNHERKPLHYHTALPINSGPNQHQIETTSGTRSVWRLRPESAFNNPQRYVGGASQQRRLRYVEHAG